MEAMNTTDAGARMAEIAARLKQSKFVSLAELAAELKRQGLQRDVGHLRRLCGDIWEASGIAKKAPIRPGKRMLWWVADRDRAVDCFRKRNWAEPLLPPAAAPPMPPEPMMTIHFAGYEITGRDLTVNRILPDAGKPPRH